MACSNVTFSYSVTIPGGSFYLNFNCNGVTVSSSPTAFTNITDAYSWVLANWSIYGTWTASGTQLIVSETLCSTGSLYTSMLPPSPPPPSDGLVLTDTFELIDRNQKGLGAENMNFQSVNDISFYDIFDAGFCANVDALDMEFLQDAGTVPNKYLIRYAGDRPDIAPPTALGGFNLTEHCANGAGNSVDYSPISFWSNEVKWCVARGLKMLLNCNINDFDIAAYQDNITYTDAQVGFIGLNVFQEYESPVSCNSPLSNNGAAAAAAANTLIAGLGGLLTGKILTRDWKGINNPSSPLTDSYTTAISIVNSTSTRIYVSETELMVQADYASGRTAQQYLTSINIAVDVVFANRVPNLIAIIGQPVSITQLYSISTGFSNTFLQYYFFSRLIVKIALIEAMTPNSIECVIVPRVDMLNLKGTPNDLSNVLLLFKNFFTAGRNIYQVTLPTGFYGVASSSDGLTGTMMVINSTGSPLSNNSVNIGGTEIPFVSIQALHGSSLLGGVTYESVASILSYGIYEVTF